MPPLDHQNVHSLIYDIMNDKQRADYEEFFETDFSFEIPNVARFRVNAFNQNRGAGALTPASPVSRTGRASARPFFLWRKLGGAMHAADPARPLTLDARMGIAAARVGS